MEQKMKYQIKLSESSIQAIVAFCKDLNAHNRKPVSVEMSDGIAQYVVKNKAICAGSQAEWLVRNLDYWDGKFASAVRMPEFKELPNEFINKNKAVLGRKLDIAVVEIVPVNHQELKDELLVIISALQDALLAVASKLKK